MDKIYSRMRIKIPKIKQSKSSKTKFFIFIIFLSIFVIIVTFIFESYSIFIATCKSAAASKSNNIIMEEVSKVMSNYDYEDLINIEKDEKGNVSLIKANVVLINKITSEIEQNIQKRIDNSPTTMVYINYGTVSRYKYVKVFWT